MEKPIPAPREIKKPIPTPRRNINKINQVGAVPKQEVIQESLTEISITTEECKIRGNDEKTEQFNTFSRRVTNASKQIAGDIGQMVQDKKKAVIEGTRQSVRRLTRKFSSASQTEAKYRTNENDTQEFEAAMGMFNSIRFDSPLSRANSIYSNVENELESSSSDESVNLPPPKHPPPPLPVEELYDAPSSSSPVASSYESTKSSRLKSNQENYESVFPQMLPHNNNVDDGGSVESEDRVSLSSSWKLYDRVEQEENIYANMPNEEENKNEIVLNITQPESQVLLPSKIENSQNADRKAVESSDTNSIYENHELIFPNRANTNQNPARAKSILMQFDPLNLESNTEFSDLNLLEDLLEGDLYGNIQDSYTFDGDFSVSNDSDADEYINPPPPPVRFDSLPDEEAKEPEEGVDDGGSVRGDKIRGSDRRKTKVSKEVPAVKSRSNWFDQTDETDDRVIASSADSRKSWFTQVKQHVIDKTPDVFKSQKVTNNIIDRPVLGGKSFINKRGMLYKVQSGPMEDFFGEYSGRWCVLENTELICYSDNTCSTLKEHFPATTILSVQLLKDPKYKYENDDLHCFELNVTGKSRGGHKYGSRSISDRRIWMQCIAEMLTQKFKTRYTSNFIRMGWAYVREGVSGKWKGAWLILSERELHYAIDRHSVKTMDLRKARCIILQAYDVNDNNPKTNDKGPNMLVDCPDLALYLRMWTCRETKVWCHIVKLEAHSNGANLDQQQLTKNDIPVIVEKCINFIYAHGSMSEGIYRKAGTGSVVSDLLFKFRKDAFAIQLTKNICTEFEVATALKRFFRELPEPLFGTDHRQYLLEVAKHNVKEEKVRMFKAALDQLPPVSYKTSRKLLGHLHFISLQREKNLMTIENLAAIWSPTLMHYDDANRPKKGSDHAENAEVVAQLIRYYRDIFPEDPGELEKEKIMLKVLERYNRQGSVNNKTAGDLRVWIYLFNKKGKAYNLAISPSKTAYEVCVELSDKIGKEVHELTLEEVVLEEKLIRPIHHTEKILDVVLRWSYWEEADRKNNYIACVALSKYWEYIIERPMALSGDLKFANSKSKVAKQMHFRITEGALKCFKDKASDTSLFSWDIKKLTWYLGHESKRTLQSKCTITFFEEDALPTRLKGSPFFGNVLMWTDAGVRANWMGAMLKCKYPNNLTPPPRFIVL